MSDKKIIRERAQWVFTSGKETAPRRRLIQHEVEFNMTQMNAPVTASQYDLWSIAVRCDRGCLSPRLNNCVCFLGGSTRQVNGTPHKGFVRPEQLLEGKVSVCVMVYL